MLTKTSDLIKGRKLKQSACPTDSSRLRGPAARTASQDAVHAAATENSGCFFWTVFVRKTQLHAQKYAHRPKRPPERPQNRLFIAQFLKAFQNPQDHLILRPAIVQLSSKPREVPEVSGVFYGQPFSGALTITVVKASHVTIDASEAMIRTLTNF